MDLYAYLVDFGLEFVKESLMRSTMTFSDDFIERCQALSRRKMEAMKIHPDLFNFFSTSFLVDKDIPELHEYIVKELEYAEETHELLYSGLDTSRFRDDMSAEELLKLIKWTLDGYEQQLIQSLNGKMVSEMDLSPYWDEYDEFIVNLKKVYYK